MDQQELKELLDYNPDTGIFTWRVSKARRIKVGSISGTVRKDGYSYIRINGKSYLAHRLAWLYVHGVMPPDQIDHINHVRYDNRLVNLRLVTHQQNNFNKSKPLNNSSGTMGVSWHKRDNKWESYIMINQRRIHLGYFANFNDAVLVRKQAELTYNFHNNHGKD